MFFIVYLIIYFYRSVKSDSNESCELIEKVKRLLDTERVKTAVPKTSLNFLQEELVGDVRKR